MGNTLREAFAALGLLSMLAAWSCGRADEGGGTAGAGAPQAGGRIISLPASSAGADSSGATGQAPVTAVVLLQPTQGNTAQGTLTLMAHGRGVHVSGRITGLTPGPHGIHVHEHGDCSAPDAASAGGHYAPGNTPHGAPTNPPSQRHAGDWGNIQADSTGMAAIDLMDTVATLSGPNTIVGRAVVVHAGRDDLTSQPAGNSGPRVACGTIEQR